MEFIKWPHMENLHNLLPATFEDFRKLPTKWVVSEKIDGTNFSISITSDNYTVGRRNAYLNERENFFNIQNNIKEMEPFIYSLQERIKGINKEYPLIERLVLFGEYYGNKIIRKINYGVDTAFKIFGVYSCSVEGIEYWYSYEDMEELFDSLCSDYIIKPIKICDTFDEAISLKNNNPTTYSDSGDEMEGLVISPYYHPYFDKNHFYLVKNKNPKFLEMSDKKVEHPVNLEIKEMHDEFLTYCNSNRMLAVISKLGKPEGGTKQAGIYIKAMIEDALEEFILNNPKVNELDKGQKRSITNVGKLGFSCFCEALKELG